MADREQVQHLAFALGERISLCAPFGVGFGGDQARAELRVDVAAAAVRA